MPTDQNPSHGRRPNFHRGRRGQDRRGNERRGLPQPQEQSGREGGRESGRDGVDVEHIMREIRSRISQRHGIELSTPQIQELAARRLEAILDPRTIKPSLLEQIRRSAATPLDARQTEPDAAYTFEENTLYETPRGALRFIRRLLNPLLKLFFNPTPLIHALNTQVRLNKAIAAREAERERRQAEWNALHYDILQRLVTEIARTSIETQSLSMRVDALSAKVDFADRRARSVEGPVSVHQPRPPAPRPPVEAPAAPAQVAQVVREGAPHDAAVPQAASEGTGESGRRRRRRRRGRRPQGVAEGVGLGAVAGSTASDAPSGHMTDGGDGPDTDEPDDDEAAPDFVLDDVGFSAPILSAADPAPSHAEATAQQASLHDDSPAAPTHTPDAPQDEPPSTDVVPQPDPGPPDR